MADATVATESTETTDEFVNTVVIEDAGPAKKRLTITIPPEAIAEKIEDSIGTLGSEASVPGFRRGKAPRALLERRFGKAVRNETKNQLVADAYAKALEAHSLRPVGNPEPVESLDEIELKEGEALTFSVDVEIVPTFEFPALEGVKIRKPIVDITGEHIDAEIESQLFRAGTPEPRESGFVENDRLVGRLAVTRNDEDAPFFVEENGIVVVPPDEDGGRGPIVGLMIDDLGPRLKEAKVGDTITIETTGPDAHERGDLRGQKLTIVFAVREGVHVIPATPEEIVERFGLGSVENLREQVRMSLEHRRDQEQRTAMREQIHEYLLEHIDFELPEKASEAQVSRTMERQRLELLYRGRSAEQVEAAVAQARESSEARIRERLKLQFILFRLGDHFDIGVDEQELNGAVAMMAAQHNTRPAKLKADLAKAGRLGELASQIREHKAVDRVVEKADITDVSAEEWNAEFAAKQEAGDGAGAKKKPSAKKTGSKKTTTKKKTQSKA
ncbi:MAG: trigger factor [Phycisphaerales bacterium]|nr:trigger factor [Phycisphaerales bacterium]